MELRQELIALGIEPAQAEKDGGIWRASGGGEQEL